MRRLFPKFRGLWIALFVVCLSSITTPSYAQFNYWQSNSGGVFQDPVHWSLGHYPLSWETAVFPPLDPQTVTFETVTRTASLRVTGGDYEFELSAAAYDSGSLIVSDSSTVDTATLTLFGGVLNVNAATIGDAADELGHVELTNGAVFNSTGTLHVGSEGIGSLSIGPSGGELNTNGAALGYFAYAEGHVTLQGADSSWTDSGTVTLGRSFRTRGTLQVLDGASMTSAAAIVGGYNCEGMANVEGTGSTWTVSGQLLLGQISGASGTLNILNGGFVSSNTAILGDRQAARGLLNIDGVGSQWLNGNSLRLGGISGARGVLTITGGAAASTATAELGVTNGGRGEVTVGGDGSNWTVDASLEVGASEGSNGTMNIMDGGQVTSGSTTVGGYDSGDGSITVDGADSLWQVNGPLDLRRGTLTINNGGAFSSTTATLENGSVTVGGAGSTWTDSGTVTLGSRFGSQSTLQVLDGASMTSAAAIVGDYSSTGVANVEGAGSTWTVSGRLLLGNYSGPSGTLNILNGGFVSSGTAILGDRMGAQGFLNVDGVGSQWLNGNSLVIGADGGGTEGFLAITGGAAASTATAQIGLARGGRGEVTVSGDGSTWTIDASLEVGASETSRGTMNVIDGGQVTSGSTTVGELNSGEGSITVGGAGSTWTVNGSIDLVSAATFTIDPGATVNVSDTLGTYSGGKVQFNGGALNVGALETDEGTFNWTDGALRISGPGGVGIGGSGQLAPSHVLTAGKSLTVGGTTTIAPDGFVLLNGSTFSTGQLVNNGTLIVARGTLELTGGDVTVGTSGIGGALADFNANTHFRVPNGQLRVEQGAAVTANGTLLAAGADNSGHVNTVGGSLTFTAEVVNRSTGQINAIGSTLNFDDGITNHGEMNLIHTTVNGNVVNPAGSRITAGGTVVFNGDVNGGGQFPGSGTVIFNGTFSPGDSPAIVSFAGDLAFGTAAELQIEIGGTKAGSRYDVLEVAGLVSLDGTLNVHLIDGFTPQLGDTFTVLHFGASQGVFDEITGLSFGDLTFDVQYTPTSLTLTTVPETGSLTLTVLALATLACCVRGRRRAKEKTTMLRRIDWELLPLV